METVLDPGAVILERIADLEVERAKIDARISAEMLDFADLRRRESEWTDDLKHRRMEMQFAAEELGTVLKQPEAASSSTSPPGPPTSTSPPSLVSFSHRGAAL